MQSRTEAVRESWRQLYLGRLGLSHDPFATQEAEDELENTDQRSHFFSYLIPAPLYSVDQLPSPQALRLLRHGFIFGASGSGKTALRLAVEADFRMVLDRTLVVRYVVDESSHESLSPEGHWSRLARSLAKDLFIQVIEHFNPLETLPTSKQIGALRRQLIIGGPKLLQVVRRIVEEPVPDVPGGFGAYWSEVYRPTVTYVPASHQLRELLNEISFGRLEATLPLNFGAVRSGLEDAASWGFKRVFILVDMLDTMQRTPEAIAKLIAPLLNTPPDPEWQHWSAKNVFFRFFLSTALQRHVRDLAKNPDFRSAFLAEIRWDDASLRRLLARRFSAANSRYTNLDSLAGAGLDQQLDALVVRSAAGSPRQMLRVLSSLIDVHVASTPRDPKFNLEDWNQVRS